MASSGKPNQPPCVLAAFVIVSKEVAASRKPVLQLIDQSVAPLSLTGRVERIEGNDPSDARDRMQAQQKELQAGVPTTEPLLLELNPKTLEDEKMRSLVRGLHLRQVSNAFKHHEALQRVAKLQTSASETVRFALVLEDDALFGENMVTALASAAASAPANADVVFLGLPSTRPKPPAEGTAFDDPLEIFKDHVLPACESYLVTPAGAAKLAAAFLPVHFSAAAQLTYLLRKGAAQAYIAVPNAFVDGSKVGIVASSIETNNQLLWNQGYCRMDAIARRMPAGGGPYTAEAQAQFEALWAEQPFKEHPDALVLRADHLFRAGKHADAEDVYAKALAAFDREGCIINQSSDFLKRYMGLYGHLQGGSPP